MQNLFVKSLLLISLFAATSYAETTFPSGSTFSNGEWHNPGESPTAKKQLEKNGYYVSGTALTIRVGKEDYTVDLREMSGKSKQMRQDFVKDEIKEQIKQDRFAKTVAALESEFVEELNIEQGLDEFDEMLEPLDEIINLDEQLLGEIDTQLESVLAEEIEAVLSEQIASELDAVTSTIEQGLSELSPVNSPENNELDAMMSADTIN